MHGSLSAKLRACRVVERWANRLLRVMLPQEMGCGSGSTCWRRLRDWQEEAGVWEELHRALLDRLGEAERIDWERASVDSSSVPATRGAEEPARIRRIREKRARSAGAHPGRTQIQIS